MTPDALSTRLRPGTWPPVEEPARLLRALEEAADRRPSDAALAETLRQAHGLATAGDGVPSVVAGVRREAVVRWDTWTATWDGPHLASGRPSRVRALRSHAARDPVLRRALLREGRALQEAVGDLGLQGEEGPWPALRVALPGAPLPLAAEEGDRGRTDLLGRMLGAAIADLARWEHLRLGLPPLDRRELIDTGDGLRIVCLSPVEPREAGERVRAVALALEAWSGAGDSSVETLLAGFATFPPRTAHEAATQLRAALAQELAAQRHQLGRRWVRIHARARVADLLDRVLRLHHACPPPEGRGAVGVDLDGRITLVRCEAGEVRWGPEDDLAPIRAADGEIRVREARRLLRTRAASPPNPRLDERVGGSAGYADDLCRWLTAAVQLRTIRLLLEAAT